MNENIERVLSGIEDLRREINDPAEDLLTGDHYDEAIRYVDAARNQLMALYGLVILQRKRVLVLSDPSF